MQQVPNAVGNIITGDSVQALHNTRVTVTAACRTHDPIKAYTPPLRPEKFRRPPHLHYRILLMIR